MSDLDEPEIAVCLVFDKRGNAFDAFDYTAETLRAEADRLDGTQTIYWDGAAPSPGTEAA